VSDVRGHAYEGILLAEREPRAVVTGVTLTLGVSHLDEETVVCCHGALTVASARLFRDVLSTALGRQPRRVVLLLEGATAMDAAAVGVLLAMRQRASRSSTELTLAAPSPSVARLVRLLRLGHALSEVPEAPSGWADPCLCAAE
jgi:anti-anti-sigma factor